MNLWLLLLIPLCAWLNRVRGGGWGGQYLRGAPDIWVAAFGIGPIAWGGRIEPHTHLYTRGRDLLTSMFTVPPWLLSDGAIRIEGAILFALCWLAWSTPAWGTIYRLGFIPGPDRPGKWYERLFIWMGGGNLVIAFFLRMTIFLIPMGVVFGLVWVTLGVPLTLAYVLGWMVGERRTANNPRIPLDGIGWDEPFAGAIWGGAILLFGAIA